MLGHDAVVVDVFDDDDDFDDGGGGHARVVLHVVPWAVRRVALAHWMPLPRVAELVDRHARRAVAGLLAARRVLTRALQRPLEAMRRAALRDTGIAWPPKAVASPLVLHDACTLYCGMATACARRAETETCASCGRDDVLWMPTVTPPVVRGCRLTRGRVDRPVAFCWSCLATVTRPSAEPRGAEPSPPRRRQARSSAPEGC